MRISDWSSDVCSSDLTLSPPPTRHPRARPEGPGQVTGRLPWILVSSTRMTEGKSGSAWASCLRFSERHALRGAIDAHDAFLVDAVLVGDRKSTRLNSSHKCASRRPYSAINTKKQ